MFLKELIEAVVMFLWERGLSSYTPSTRRRTQSVWGNVLQCARVHILSYDKTELASTSIAHKDVIRREKL